MSAVGHKRTHAVQQRVSAMAKSGHRWDPIAPTEVAETVN
jgi:hypothetical protein